VATTPAKRACSVCGTLLADDSAYCPVCALRMAVETQSDSVPDTSSELRFEHYQVLQNADGKPFELGRGAMGVTYKAFDVHLQRPVALKIISAQLFGNDSARLRFVREARAAASVQHPNVASVFHIGESGGNYFYAMELVNGETLAALIRRSGCLKTDLALEIVGEIAAGLAAIEKQHLVHRDIKPGNIMVSLQDAKLENVKIIDLGLAKGAAEENTLSTVGAFVGTPAYASPEQFAGIATDIRSDLYSLGITLWEMLSGKLPFGGSTAELMYQHQHADPPTEKLRDVPAAMLALLEVLLAKDPGQRFQSPNQFLTAVPKVKGAIASNSPLSQNELRSPGDQIAEQSSERKSRKHALRWALAASLCLAGLLAWFFYSGYRVPFFNQRSVESIPTEKSIAVLPFENISPNKDDAYFADGVQDEILNNLAKIAQLKVISRTSVMQYRVDTKRDLRQIANTLGVTNVLEGAVRRDRNHVRVSIELIDAGNDHTVWADSYDRDLTDIFAIQSEVAQTVAIKLTATLSPQEKKSIEAKPTDSLEAYDLYIRGKRLVMDTQITAIVGNVSDSLREAVSLQEQAVRLDPKFTLAYCVSAEANDILYHLADTTPERRALAEAAVKSALRTQPDLPEVRLAYAHYLYFVDRNYDQAWVQLTIARRGLPNNTEAVLLAALMDRRQGNFAKAIQEFNEAIKLDPRNTFSIAELYHTLCLTLQFRAAEEVYRRLTEFLPDQSKLKLDWASWKVLQSGDDSAFRSALTALPTSMMDDDDVLSSQLTLALNDRNWVLAKNLIDKKKNGEDTDDFAYGDAPVPVGCLSVLLARLQGEQPGANSSFAEAREQLNQKVQRSSGNAKLLSQLAVLDALLNNKEAAISEAKRAVAMLPISKDAISGPGMVVNLALVYTWSNELDLAFEVLTPVTKTPCGIYYGDLKLDPYWDPLRKDPRFDKLLAEIAPKD
jgi:serine/threonine protein kinase/Flp pilus assembly protein TadD